MTAFGGIEAGGTKWVCAVGTGPDDIRDSIVFPTGAPGETIARATDFLRTNGALDAVGVGSFGPVDLRRGRITTTPKPGWRDTDLASVVAAALDVPVAFDTDVNAAALGEHRWGAAQGLDTFVYVTVGTGIGGGAMVDGRLVHGMQHPEIGHMRIPHDRERDPFSGICPYHGDCLEGLASGEAMKARGNTPLELEAEYLALGLLNVVTVLSPQLIVLGGGVMHEAGLLELVGARMDELAAGYVDLPDVVPPALGDRAGVLGALELARAQLELLRASN
ncbi:MAG TPA: ROK family protein [Gaiellaceae bacterium]|nr:ROK family protein [Gaiellaceae bacterium]